MKAELEGNQHLSMVVCGHLTCRIVKGWVTSARDCPIFYKVPYFTTVQDYMVMEAINIWVRDKLHKKRHRVTLRVSSSKRDHRKTEISTFANFIRRKDAQIAMNVVDVMLAASFVIWALQPIVKRELDGPTEGCFANRVIPTEMPNYYLKANVPENISKKMKATWEERITGLVTSYEDYTRYIEQTTHLDPHPGLIIATHHFSEPYPLVNEVDLLCLATMDLLIQFAYPSLSGYGKFTISFTMIDSYKGEFTFTLAPAIPLTDQDGDLMPKRAVFAFNSFNTSRVQD
ncbi:DNA-dependent RNA polymerase [Olea europaea subsp. europaea]|uniref:DNA-dependent RNA polymerase (Mitochondrion) n=1 Tax=Olea europaea subsp. europaea TaxID=158383 RepID=A0A8S0PKY8_OLEEU|nr:DNA-dependent RNA polymerase [Olea europaea subsp. europaea]